jgi:mevalonate kinase
MSTAYAPGKVILFGEHAVVYGQPALAAPVTQVQTEVQINETRNPGIWIDAADIQLHSRLDLLPPSHPIAATIHGTLDVLKTPIPSGITILIRSTIPVASGLGSGAAVSVALIRAMAEYAHKTLPNEQVSALAYETEKLHHGTPSGIDNTVITYVRPVYFIKGQPIKTVSVQKPFTIVIGDTGIAASTRESVQDVRAGWQKDRGRFESLFAAIGSIVRTARQSLEAGSPDGLGSLMDENHALLQEIGVSSPELDRLVASAKNSGALGAKLSGGGRGGNMIALVKAEETEAVAKSLLAAGARNTITTEIV